jgi:allene oxide cyclase-like protein
MRIRLVLCVALALTFWVASSAASVKPQMFSLLEVDTSFVPIGGWNESSNRPPAIGQGFAFGGVLYKWAGAKRGKAVGRIAAMCTRATTTHFLCDGSLFLPGGVIELQAPVGLEGEGAFDVSIVGGTGAYAGARGFMRSTPIGGDDSSKSGLAIHLL